MKPKTKLWLGRVITAIPVLFLVFDTVIKFMNIAPVQESFRNLGFERNLALEIAIVELILLVLYLVPRTAVLGAVLWTGYLGGAIATHLRLGNPLFSHILFPTYVALLLWMGLWLRDARVRVALQPRME